MPALMFLAAALVLGMRHALDPDHVVAVSTLAAEERRLWPAARLGLIWGLGHLLPLLVLGLPILVLRLELPGALEHGVDLGAGVLLMVLGARTLWRLRREQVYLHLHGHDGQVHAHFHCHRHGGQVQGECHGQRPAGRVPGHCPHTHPLPGRERRGLLTFAIGVVHGLAGSGAAALLALTAAPSAAAGAGYLIAFGAGTCAGMFLMTLCIAAPALSALSRRAALRTAVRAAAGLASMAVGAFMWYEILPGLLP